MRDRAAEALARIEASHLAAQLVGEMSAGEKRRISLPAHLSTGRTSCFSMTVKCS